MRNLSLYMFHFKVIPNRDTKLIIKLFLGQGQVERKNTVRGSRYPWGGIMLNSWYSESQRALLVSQQSQGCTKLWNDEEEHSCWWEQILISRILSSNKLEPGDHLIRSERCTSLGMTEACQLASHFPSLEWLHSAFALSDSKPHMPL